MREYVLLQRSTLSLVTQQKISRKIEDDKRVTDKTDKTQTCQFDPMKYLLQNRSNSVRLV